MELHQSAVSKDFTLCLSYFYYVILIKDQILVHINVTPQATVLFGSRSITSPQKHGRKS